MRVIVAGAVAWSDFIAIRRELEKLPPGTTIIHGDCEGADAIAGQIARELGFAVEAMDKNSADRDKYGKLAWKGLNERMIATGADLILAFHPDIAASNGSKHLLELAESGSIESRVFNA